jgi:hypothetical protein
MDGIETKGGREEERKRERDEKTKRRRDIGKLENK